MRRFSKSLAIAVSTLLLVSICSAQQTTPHATCYLRTTRLAHAATGAGTRRRWHPVLHPTLADE